VNPCRLSIALVLAAVCNFGCSEKSQSTAQNPPPVATGPASSAATPASGPAAGSDEAAIKAAIDRHLRENSGINLSAMDSHVDSISIQGNEAKANVTFSLRQGGTSMTMEYRLTRKGNDWVVERSQPGGGQFAHPPLDKTHSGTAGNATPPGTPDLRRFYKDGSAATPSPTPSSNSSPQN